MAKLSDIRAKIKVQLEALINDDGGALLTQVYIDPMPKGQMPYAQIVIGGGEPNPDVADVNGSVDHLFGLIVRVICQSSDTANEIWEDLLTVWFDQTRYLELAALGVLRIRPISSAPPIVFHGSKDCIFDMEYLLEVRYPY